MGEDGMKEVYFYPYCGTCAHKDLAEDEDPCDGCLGNPVNLYSHKPVGYKEQTED